MPLQADVYVAPPIPFKNPRGKVGGNWSPCSCTLIQGDREAILIDTAITNAQNEAIADFIESRLKGTTPKVLKYIYITHGHADHFLGINLLMKRFPGVKAVATAGTIAHMKDQIEPKAFASQWYSRFPGELDEEIVLAEPLPADGKFELEGYALQAVEVGQADTHDSTVLWCPDLKLAACGDVVYGTVHQMLGECDTRAKRAGWIKSIRTVEALQPEIVVPGHMQATEIPGVWHLAASRKYIEDFQNILDSDAASDPRSLSKLMIEKYPSRYNDSALIVGCMAAFRRGAKGSKM